MLCTGAYDRPIAFPGWTLPGVLTAGGAQALAKGQGVLPGKRVLLAGAGPFLLPVAAQLASLGADVVAVAEATRRREWLAAGPRMAAYPQRLAEYAKYRTKVRRIVWGHVIVRAEGDGRVQHATLAEAAPDWSPDGRRARLRGRRGLHRLRLPPVRRPGARARLRAGRRRRRPQRGHGDLGRGRVRGG